MATEDHTHCNEDHDHCEDPDWVAESDVAGWTTAWKQVNDWDNLTQLVIQYGAARYVAGFRTGMFTDDASPDPDTSTPIRSAAMIEGNELLDQIIAMIERMRASRWG